MGWGTKGNSALVTSERFHIHAETVGRTQSPARWHTLRHSAIAFAPMKTPPTLLVSACILCATARGAELDLPDPLSLQSGEKISEVSAWRERRRPEVLELFRTHVYGRTPVGRPDGMKFEVLDTLPDAMEGKAVRKQVKITLPGAAGKAAIRLLLFIPKNTTQPAPCFLFICNRGPDNIDPAREKKSPFWPAEEIVARGYAAATFHNADVAPDKPDAWTKGVHALYDTTPRPPDAWGTIAAWAWGASRCMDYLVTDPAIDAARVAVVGHSRGGKTALWAGAEDSRFAMVVSNCSGSTGAAIARQKQGENIRRINTSFPHWFCDNYKRFNDREAELPVDQHMLAALSAPRPLYIASATGDPGAHPAHEFFAGVHASPVYRLFGLRGLAATEMPAPDAPSHEGKIGYHIRTGKHDLTVYDWSCFMDFADRHLRKASAPQP